MIGRRLDSSVIVELRSKRDFLSASPTAESRPRKARVREREMSRHFVLRSAADVSHPG